MSVFRELGARTSLAAWPVKRRRDAPHCLSNEQADSGSAYYPFSGAAYIFASAQMSLILTHNVVALRLVLGFESSAATRTLSNERSFSPRDEDAKSALKFGWSLFP